MSKATKRKHVTKEVLDEYVLPEGNQKIVKICASRGNNLHEAEDCQGHHFLVSMPTKFRKNVWIKRGDYVLTEPIEEGDKVKAEIVHILYKDQIKYIQTEGLWPAEFAESEVSSSKDEMIPDDMLPPSDDDSDYDGDMAMLNANPNRPVFQNVDSEEESSEEEGSSEEDQDDEDDKDQDDKNT